MVISLWIGALVLWLLLASGWGRVLTMLWRAALYTLRRW